MADINDLFPHDEDGRLRIIQEHVPGKQITLAHIIGSPRPIVYKKLGLILEQADGIFKIADFENLIGSQTISAAKKQEQLNFRGCGGGGKNSTGYGGE